MDANNEIRVDDTLICTGCDVEMAPQKVTLSYMGYAFSATMPRCPVCGYVYIPEEIAKGRMGEVERQLEEK